MPTYDVIITTDAGDGSQDTISIYLSSPLPSLARTVIPSHERMTNDLAQPQTTFSSMPATFTFDQPPPHNSTSSKTQHHHKHTIQQ